MSTSSLRYHNERYLDFYESNVSWNVNCQAGWQAETDFLDYRAPFGAKN